MLQLLPLLWTVSRALPENHLLAMIGWLGELVVASFLLSYGAEHLSAKYGSRFIGRTLMSVATTFPEIAIVVYAAADGFYGTAMGAGLGSNLLMMTLGLALMLLIATTRLSKSPLKGINVTGFKLDKVFLLLSAITGALLFVNGYDLLDGLVFSGLFFAYIVFAFREMRNERLQARPENKSEPNAKAGTLAPSPNRILVATLIFTLGTVGVFFGAQPFIASLEGLAADSGVSVVALAVIVSPIAGEMPEKLSMMILARKGEAGASIAIANVLGSKILNNTLLLAVLVFGAVNHAGFSATIAPTPILNYQVILVTAVTVIALLPMFRKEIGRKTGIGLTAMYCASLFLQFLLPHEATAGSP